jgi:predicted RNase H-like HicB family nuclease
MQGQIAESMIAGESPKLTIRIEAVDEGGFTAECLEIPGCVSEGETAEEAEANIRLAIDACLSVIFEDLLTQIKTNASAIGTEPSQAVRLETVSINLPRLADEAA